MPRPEPRCTFRRVRACHFLQTNDVSRLRTSLYFSLVHVLAIKSTECRQECQKSKPHNQHPTRPRISQLAATSKSSHSNHHHHANATSVLPPVNLSAKKRGKQPERPRSRPHPLSQFSLPRHITNTSPTPSPTPDNYQSNWYTPSAPQSTTPLPVPDLSQQNLG